MKYLKHFAFLSFLVGVAFAETFSFKGTGTVFYEPEYVLLSEKVPVGTEDRAASIGVDNAWKKYVASFSSDRKNASSLIASELNDSKESFILDKKITATSINKDAKKFTAAVRIEVDDSAVERFILEKTKKGNEKSYGEAMTWLFVTRGQASIKNYDDRVVKINSSKSGNSNSESQTYQESETSIRASEEISKSRFNKQEKGGSTTKKSSEITRKILSSKEIDASMRQALINAGYEGYMYGQIAAEPECGAKRTIEQIRNEFGASIDISSDTQRDITRTARRCEMKYTAIGTLDVMPAKSQGRKMIVDVSVTAQVFDTSGRFARNIASVGPVVFGGEGPSEEVARFNALKKAGQSAASTIINQLRAR